MSTSIQPVSAAGHIGPNRTIYCSEAETASSAAEHLTLGAFVEGSIDTDIEKEAANVAEDRLFESNSATTDTIRAFFSKRLIGHRKLSPNTQQNQIHSQDLYCHIKTQPPPHEQFPMGWPRLAALMHSEENLSFCRKFGLTRIHCILDIQAELQGMEKQLNELDWSGHDNSQTSRSKASDSETKTDPARQELLTRCRKKLSQYDKMIFNFREIRKMGSVEDINHKSLFNWIMIEKPLGVGERDFIYEAYDSIPLTKVSKFETSMLATSFRKIFNIRSNSSDQQVQKYSTSSIAAFVKLVYVLLAVAIMAVPAFLLQWVSMSRAWESVTMLIFIVGFSSFLSLGTEVQIQFVLVGTAAYWAVLVTLLSNLQAGNHGKQGGISS